MKAKVIQMDVSTELNIEIDASDLMDEIDLSDYIDVDSQTTEVIITLLEQYTTTVNPCGIGEAFEDAVTKAVRKVMSSLWKPQEGEATHAPSND